MTIPVWVLLIFAGWTLVTLFGSVGVYRWSRILTGRREISSFTPESPRGADWYQRAVRAHANCVENLSVYGAVVVAIVATGVRGTELNVLAIIFMVARVFHTVIHIGFPNSNPVAAVRFSFYLTQMICVFAMGIDVAIRV